MKMHDAGGYAQHKDFVNMVHRTQTSHHPDPPDPRPAKQDISVYFGPLTYGRVSFAILADRMLKTGPEGTAPKTGGRADHVTARRQDGSEFQCRLGLSKIEGNSTNNNTSCTFVGLLHDLTHELSAREADARAQLADKMRKQKALFLARYATA